jgi:hypothetical protein
MNYKFFMTVGAACIFCISSTFVEAKSSKPFEVTTSYNKFSQITSCTGAKNLVKSSSGPKIDVNILKVRSEKSTEADCYLTVAQEEFGIFSSLIHLSTAALLTIDDLKPQPISFDSFKSKGKSTSCTTPFTSNKKTIYLDENILAKLLSAKRLVFEVEAHEHQKIKEIQFTVEGSSLENLKTIVSEQI